ncbi:zinc finger, CCHC-type containing protein [Tanacetum coccineum]|uniref:Zinc finger, CCHC-type containing protein n=1 Tax=Tanacetum coccineum TaxID=301880 RepID=A0ABQ4WWU4_9ASTR
MAVIMQPWNKSGKRMLNLPKNYEIPWRPNIWLRMHQVRSSLFTQHKMSMDEAIQVSCIIENFLLFENISSKHLKEELPLVELGSHLRIKESLRVQDGDKLKDNNVDGPLGVSMVEHNNSSWYNDNKGKRKHHDNTRVDPNKKAKPICWKCGKIGHIKMDCKGGNVGNKANGSGIKGSVDGSSNSLKCQNIFNKSLQTYESLNDGSILHMGNESTALVHGRGCVDLRLNIVNDNIASAFMSTSKLNDLIIWHARLGHVHFKSMQDMSKDGLIPAFDMDIEKWNKKYFVTFIDDASRTDSGGEYMDILYFQSFGIIHETTALYTPQQDGISERKNRVLKEIVNYMVSYLGLSQRDVIFDENRFSSVPRPSLRIPNRTKDIGGSMVLEEITKEVVQQPKPELRKSKRNRTPKNFGHGFQLYLIEGTKDEVDLTKEFLSSRFSMKDMGEVDVILGIRIKHESNGIAISKSHYIKKVLTKFNYFDCTPVSTPMDTSEKVMPNNGQAVSQLEYSRVIDCLMYVMTCTRPDIAFAVGKLRRYTSNPVLEGYTDASWISNSEDNSSTNDWVFLLGGGVISWASKKQTCITGSTIESEFVALATASKEAAWLRNLILDIPLWSKLIAPISIRCDSAATLAKAYSQMYNKKSRHLGVRHSMIRELITNEVISIEFVRSQQNLADHLTKRLAKDLVIKSAEGMGLKSN